MDAFQARRVPSAALADLIELHVRTDHQLPDDQRERGRHAT
jgi:hypothetical protein